MNKKRMTPLLCMLVLTFLITGISGCEKNSETLDPLAGMLVKYEGCKQTTSTNIIKSQASDCIEFNYDGESILTLKHTNCGFNCCPGTLSAEISFDANQIIIVEKENQQGCRCSCLYDLYYEIKNLHPGSYTIHIIEPNVTANDPVMHFKIDLLSATSGSHCVERNHYPWVQ